MKKSSLILSGSVAMVVVLLSACSNKEPGRVYVPDMAYSRAYETFLQRDSLKFTTESRHSDDKIFYNALPVAGTLARGELAPFDIPKDKAGDTANYVASKVYVNPLPDLDSNQMKEAERLFLINCAICHGAKLDGNGPLYKDGSGPYPGKPANFVDPAYQNGVIYNMPEGQMYYSVTYGKNLMGSYASQLNRKQRWMVIDYIKSKQQKASKSAAGGTSSDSTASTTTATAAK